MRIKTIFFLALFILALLFIFFYISSRSITGKVVFAPSDGGRGQIYAIAITPEIKVLEKASVQVSTINRDEEKKGFKLYLYVIKDSIVRESSDFSFTLNPSGMTTVSMDFTPESIGEYEILTKLYNKDETTLLDSKSAKTNSVSEVGPFDLSIDMITRQIAPSSTLPIIVRMLNTGRKGSEVDVRVRMYCTERISEETFAIFLQPNVKAEKSISLMACNEKGFKTVAAELEMFNSTIVISSSQVYLEKPYPIMIDVPDMAEVKSGQNIILSAFIKNDEDTTRNDVRVIIEGIPPSWISTKPERIDTLEPGETAVFQLTISVPQDADVREHTIKIDVGSNHGFGSKEAVLKVTKAEKVSGKAIYEKDEENAIEKNKNVLLYVFSSLLAIIFLFIVRGITKARSSHVYKKRSIALGILRGLRR